MVDPSLRAFLDESSARRDNGQQIYLVCAAMLPAERCEALREHLRPLLLPGQIKLHWTAESERRRKSIVSRILELGPLNVVVSHVDEHRKKTERYRRKCLETLYYALSDEEVFDLTLESRDRKQDGNGRAHIVNLQGQGLDRRLRIRHQRGGDEPLLWIADAVLGAINADHRGVSDHLEALRETIYLDMCTPGSARLQADERP